MAKLGVVLLSLLCAQGGAASAASSYDDGDPQPDAPVDSDLEEPGQPRLTSNSKLRNPQGSVVVQGLAGMSSSEKQFSALIGLGVGYAIFTGVVPGVRGALFLGDVFGGEILATATLSPPLEGSVVPFVVGEVGHRWQSELGGLIYGVGGGFFLGDPAGNYGLQLGVVYRIWEWGGPEPIRSFAPIVGLSLRF